MMKVQPHERAQVSESALRDAHVCIYGLVVPTKDVPTKETSQKRASAKVNKLHSRQLEDICATNKYKAKLMTSLLKHISTYNVCFLFN